MINPFMQEALLQAEIAYKAGEVPVGAIIVDSTKNLIIAKTYNLVEKRKNPLMHAEVLAINEACAFLGDKYLVHCDLYVTLEPCAMCAAAISYAKIRRLIYAASDYKQGAVEHNGRFFTTQSCFHRPEIYPNISATPATILLQEFFKNLRKIS